MLSFCSCFFFFSFAFVCIFSFGCQSRCVRYGKVPWKSNLSTKQYSMANKMQIISDGMAVNQMWKLPKKKKAQTRKTIRTKSPKFCDYQLTLGTENKDENKANATTKLSLPNQTNSQRNQLCFAFETKNTTYFFAVEKSVVYYWIFSSKNGKALAVILLCYWH